MNIALMLDNDTADAAEHLAPHKNVASINKYRTLTSASRFPKPVASTLANFLHSPRVAAPSPQKQAFLQSLAM